MQKKSRLIIMCGAPGLGKSTWVKNHEKSFGEKYRIVSRDTIRFSTVKEEEEYFSHEDAVWNIFVNEINNGLSNNETVIADATHLNYQSRNKLLSAIDNDILKNTEIIAVVIKGSVKKALVQNENRKGTRSYVPETVIRNMYHSFRMPKFDEGFDKIYTVVDGTLIERVEL